MFFLLDQKERKNQGQTKPPRSWKMQEIQAK